MSLSPSPHLSGGRDLYKEGEGNRAKRSKEGIEKFSYVPTSTVHSGKTSDGLVCSILVYSFCLHVIQTSCHPGSKFEGLCGEQDQ